MKLTVKASNTKESYKQLNEAKGKVIADENKLSSKDFAPGETPASINMDLRRHQEEVIKAQETLNNNSKDLFEYTESINKKEMFDWIWDLIDNYKVFLDATTLDQKVALVNLIGYITLLNTSITIFLILVGNQFIL